MLCFPSTLRKLWKGNVVLSQIPIHNPVALWHESGSVPRAREAWKMDFGPKHHLTVVVLFLSSVCPVMACDTLGAIEENRMWFRGVVQAQGPRIPVLPLIKTSNLWFHMRHYTTKHINGTFHSKLEFHGQNNKTSIIISCPDDLVLTGK